MHSAFLINQGCLSRGHIIYVSHAFTLSRGTFAPCAAYLECLLHFPARYPDLLYRNADMHNILEGAMVLCKGTRYEEAEVEKV